jgi:hypothetical protein
VLDRASDEQMTEGCSAVIAAGGESAENLFRAYNNHGSAYAMSGDNRRAIDDFSEALKLHPESSKFG